MYIILKSLGFYPHNRSITGMIQLRVKIFARRLGEGWGGGILGEMEVTFDVLYLILEE